MNENKWEHSNLTYLQNWKLPQRGTNTIILFGIITFVATIIWLPTMCPVDRNTWHFLLLLLLFSTQSFQRANVQTFWMRQRLQQLSFGHSFLTTIQSLFVAANSGEDWRVLFSWENAFTYGIWTQLLLLLPLFSLWFFVAAAATMCLINKLVRIFWL